MQGDLGEVFERIAGEIAEQNIAPARNAKPSQLETDSVSSACKTTYACIQIVSKHRKNVGQRPFEPNDPLMSDRFDVAVVIPTMVRSSLVRAVDSVFEQKFKGRIQILLGIDKWNGDPSIIDTIQAHCPANCVLSILDLGYSTSTRNGGLYPAMPGGGLRTILSYAANSTRIAYLDDDNWFGESHLQTLSDALQGNSWAHTLRWYFDYQSGEPLVVDNWESVGKGRGVYAEKLGGYVDPNFLMIDKIEPVPEDRRGISEDRQVFK